MTGYVRFCLAAFVAAYHLGYDVFGIRIGPPSVIVFYVLAGSVVTYLLTSVFTRQPITVFYKERILRIFPTYLFFLFLTFLFVTLTGFGSPEYTFLNIVGNITIIPLNYVNFTQFVVLADKEFPLLPTAWSLGAELQAYVLLGFVIRSNALLRWTLGVFSLVIYAAAATRAINTDLWAYRLLPGTFFIFLSGAYLIQKQGEMSPFSRIDRSFPIAAWLCVAAITLRCYLTDKLEIVNYAMGFLIGLPLVAALVYHPIKLPLNHLFGSLSYGVFLAHIPVLWLCEWISPSLANSGFRFPLVMITSTFLSLIAVYFIENPIWRLRKAISETKA